MWDWITENSGLVQALMSAITALVWLVYLHIIVSGLLRQRRTEILIHLGGARDLQARILVSNLGFEPIYVLEIMLTVWTARGERMSSVTDRTEIGRDSDRLPREATLQGPLKSGDHVDIGNVEVLLNRARHHSFDALEPEDVERFEITVAAIASANARITAASRRFAIVPHEDGPSLQPTSLYATQIRSRWKRRQIEAQLKQLL